MVGMNMNFPMNVPDMAYVQKVNLIGQRGVEAPAEIRAIRSVGGPDAGGATLHEFDVTIGPSGADPYDAMISQSMLPGQMVGLWVGRRSPRSTTPPGRRRRS